MNGHNHHKLLESGRYSAASNSGTKSVSSTTSSCHTSIASLCNLGNTCFLNSVVYTLRFTPGFLHHFHHFVSDLGLGNNTSGKEKRRGHNNVNSVDAETERVHDVIEQLHDLFRNMASSDDHLIERESGAVREPIPPSNFLHSVSKMKFIEDNQQNDVHEFLIKLLTMMWDIKMPFPKMQPPINNVEEDNHEAPKKGDKKKGKKSFLASNGHAGINSGVKLVSSNPRSEPDYAKDDSVIKSSTPLTNFVYENFVGKNVLRTKCLECEASTYQSDKFTNIDISLTFDDDLSETMSNGFVDDSLSQRSNGALSVADLFLKQIMASETLRENNKYLCVECSRYNEAQRSVQYELLPKVLVLNLKRFTAAGNKINDFIPTPFTMNCFCTQCLPPDATPQPPGEPRPMPKHHYRLFAVIMHLGATLASGHYIAYVRASSDLNFDYSRCPKASQLEANHRGQRAINQSQSSNSSQHNKRGIMKYFSRNNDSKGSNGHLSNNSNSAQTIVNGFDSKSEHCRSANCCGMQRVLNQLNHRDAGNRYRQRSQESLNSSSNGNHSSETDSLASNNGQMEDIWLECDDENISPISRRQFEEELNSKQSAATPYLLFYERV